MSLLRQLVSNFWRGSGSITDQGLPVNHFLMGVSGAGEGTVAPECISEKFVREVGANAIRDAVGFASSLKPGGPGP